MPSGTMSSLLLDAAETLLREGKRSNAFRRRAVSTAYYAVFHALAKLCADYLTRSAVRSTDEYSRVYRSLEHGALRNAFAQSPLKEHKSLSRIGELAIKLQVERHRADYLPPLSGSFSSREVQELIDEAREAVLEIENLKPRNRELRTLATYLLFRERKQ
jgi:uncharacterized protein (UPF0332 family)